MNKTDKTKMKTVLERAATLVEKGWVTRVSARSENGTSCDPLRDSACAWCLTGALDRACYENEVKAEALLEGVYFCYRNRAEPAESSTTLSYLQMEEVLQHFNDEEAKESHEVAGLLRAAAATL